MIKVKLCGFKNKRDVDLASRLGVDFLGFVFYKKSPRNISVRKAKLITKDLPENVKKVAVIVDAKISEISQIIDHLQPHFLQIHNDDKNYISNIRDNFNIPIIKAFAIKDKSDLDNINDFDEIATMYLFDNKSQEAGGSGQSFNWQILENLKTRKKWLLSGGLNINNVINALEISQASIIDLSSAIEKSKGKKSPELIFQFMNFINQTNKIMTNKNVTKALQNVLSNSYALYLKTQNYHWNVTGPHFNALHQLFGSHYEDLAMAIDDLAERIRALDELVPASFDIFGENSEIKNGNEKLSAPEMAKDLYNDNHKLSKILNKALKIAQEAGDEATADMFIGRIKIHDKNAWMLKNSI